MRLLTTAAIALSAATVFAAAGLAQPAPAPAPARPAAAPAAAKPPAQQGPAWVSQCSSPARSDTLNCAMEQRLGVAQTGQLIAAMVIQVPGQTRQPTMILQLPLGLNLAAGATLQMDALPAVKVPVQSCDQGGCVAMMALPAATLAQMQTAKAMKLTLQGGQQKPVTVNFQMTGFAQVYDKIK